MLFVAIIFFRWFKIFIDLVEGGNLKINSITNCKIEKSQKINYFRVRNNTVPIKLNSQVELDRVSFGGKIPIGEPKRFTSKFLRELFKKDAEEVSATLKPLLETHGINSPVVDGECTPLHVAFITSAKEAVIKTLVDLGADLNSKIPNSEIYMGGTPLHCAVVADAGPKIIEYMLDNGAKMDVKGDYGETLLHLAAYWHGNPETIKLLLKRGVDIDAVDSALSTPLHIAVKRFNIGAMEVFFNEAKKPNVHARNEDGKTPILMPYLETSPEVLKKLLKLGANVHDVDNNGNTVLHALFENDTFFYDMGRKVDPLSTLKLESMKFLMENGANPNVKNLKGETPLHIATQRGDKGAYNLLLENGADSAIVDNDGKTAKDYAIKFIYDGNLNRSN